jgi:hypothetical protein
VEGAHEKGGVEGEIGRFRRRHLVAVPAVRSLAELNELIADADAADDGRVITGRPVTAGAAFTAETAQLLALPAEPFDPARTLQARVDNRSRVSVRQSFYSVPVRYVGRRLPVRLTGRTIEVLDGTKLVARHERAFGRYAESSPWTTTSKSSRPSPAGCPAQPHWPRPRRTARSPARTRPTGTRPAAPVATPPAPAPSSTCSWPTAPPQRRR